MLYRPDQKPKADETDQSNLRNNVYIHKKDDRCFYETNLNLFH